MPEIINDHDEEKTVTKTKRKDWLTEPMPAATPDEFEEYLEQFMSWRTAFRNRQEFEYFMMLPCSKNQRLLVVAKLAGCKCKITAKLQDRAHARDECTLGDCIACCEFMKQFNYMHYSEPTGKSPEKDYEQ